MKLDPEQAARLLDVRPDTLTRWVRQGLLRPVDGAGNFDRNELVRWARQRGLTLAGEGRQRWSPGQDLFADALERGAVVVDAACSSATDAIELAVAALPGVSADTRQWLLGEVLGREALASTALGHGIAVPHPRTPPAKLFTDPVVVVLFPHEPLDWAALDGEPVHTVFLLLSPTAPVHLEILSRVAFALRSSGFVDFLRERPTREQLIERLRSINKET